MTYFADSRRLSNIASFDIIVGTQPEIDKQLATHLIGDWDGVVSNNDKIMFLDGTHVLPGTTTLTEANIIVRMESKSAIITTGYMLTFNGVNNDIELNVSDEKNVTITSGLARINNKRKHASNISSKNLLENEPGVVKYENGVIFKFDQWDNTEIFQGSDDLTSGTLTSGVMYKIKTFVGGDDFSNLGGTNVSNTKFIATGTTPTNWTNSSVLYEIGHGFVVPYKNSFSNMFTGYETVGYRGTNANNILNLQGLGLTWVKDLDTANTHYLYDILRDDDWSWKSDTTAAHAKEGNSAARFRKSDSDILLMGPGGITLLDNRYVTWNWSYPLAKAWHANGGSSRKVPTPWSIVDSVESNVSSGITGDQVVIELYNPLTGNGALLYIGNGANRLLDISGGIAPGFIIGKNLSTAGLGTNIYSPYLNGGVTPGNYNINLQSTTAEALLLAVWNTDLQNSSEISLGTNISVNTNNALQILYYFAPIPGLQKFGGYAGNAVDLPTIESGCKDGMISIKRRTGTPGGWVIFDSVRDNDKGLYWDNTNIETTLVNLTNGFNSDTGYDINGSNQDVNHSPADYIYSHFGKEMVPQGDINSYNIDYITSTTANDNIEILFKYKGSATLNTELFIDATREFTPNWVELYITKLADINNDYQLLRATGSISSNASGTSMRLRIRTSESPYTEHNLKDIDFSWT